MVVLGCVHSAMWALGQQPDGFDSDRPESSDPWRVRAEAERPWDGSQAGGDLAQRGVLMRSEAGRGRKQK